MIESKEPEAIVELIKKECSVKGEGPPLYYLSDDYKMHKGRSAIGCKKYITEAIRRIEATTKPPIKRQSTPLPTRDHPELDTSKFLDNDGHRYYQMLIGMLNWTGLLVLDDSTLHTLQLHSLDSPPVQGSVTWTELFRYLDT